MKEKLLKNERALAYAQILIGCVIGAIGYPAFMTPNHIAPGGLTGVATVLNYLFPVLPVGITSLALNVPLFLIGYRAMGRVFAFRSLVATVLFSVFIDVIPIPVVTTDPLLGAVFGGVLLGIGLGLILRGGATTGGTDMAARMVHRRVPHLTVGMILFLFDCVSIVMAAVSIEITYALYSFICIYISSKVIDLVMVGTTHDVACYVITAKHAELKQRVFEELDRGVTLLSAEGGYTGEARPVLMCILSAQEVSRFKTLVESVDEGAFFFTSPAGEVMGEGFRKLSAED